MNQSHLSVIPTLSEQHDAQAVSASVPTAFVQGSMEIQLKEENIKHFIGPGMSMQGGHAVSEEGLVIDGPWRTDSLTVKGTLIIKDSGKLSGNVTCDRLINFGEIDTKGVIVVKELMIGWTGSIKADQGVYARAYQITNRCKLLGECRDIDTLPQSAESKPATPNDF